MKSVEECCFASASPAAIASALAAFQRSAWALKAMETTSSSLVMISDGVNTPCPVMAA
jgi:hypothetical protein